MTKLLDSLLAILKWPVACLSLVLLPGVLWALPDLFDSFAQTRGLSLPFAVGFAGYALAWQLLLRRRSMGSLLSTFEHEITHAIFAWGTLHRVVDLGATWSRGGHIRVAGGHNWLIAVAPYFFPTAAVAVALALHWLPTDGLRDSGHIYALLGASVAYHMTSTWLETHRKQPDLIQVGFPFAWAFLPTANLLAYGLLVAFAVDGTGGTLQFMQDVRAGSVELLQALPPASRLFASLS